MTKTEVEDEESFEKLQLQKDEFYAVSRLSKHYRWITMTAIIDDDYPEIRQSYERAVQDAINAFKRNGRIP